MAEELTDLRWVRADRLCLGDLIIYHEHPSTIGALWEVLVDRLDLAGDDVTVSGWDIASSRTRTFTTSIGNGLRIKREAVPAPRVSDDMRERLQ